MPAFSERRYVGVAEAVGIPLAPVCHLLIPVTISSPLISQQQHDRNMPYAVLVAVGDLMNCGDGG